MKIVAIADTHGKQFYNLIPECDLLLIGGDISPRKHNFVYQKYWFENIFLLELEKCKAKKIVFIAGNHDVYLFESFMKQRENAIHDSLPDNVYYLRDNTIQFSFNGKKLLIYGLPWTVKRKFVFGCFKWDENEVYPNPYIGIQSGVDIVLSHGPVFGKCDFFDSKNLGSELFLHEILKNKPKYVISGHIHDADHSCQKIHDTNLFCASILDCDNQYRYNPLILEI